MRTVEEIYNEILAAKAAEPALLSLNSTSKTAIWRLWAYIVAAAIWTHERLFELFKTEIAAASARASLGTAPWLQAQALAYQQGDLLELEPVTNKPFYATLDPSKQIIKRAAVQEAAGIAMLKVAKLDGTRPVALTSTELTAFRAYIRQIQFAGTRVLVSSNNPDTLRIAASVYYNGTLSATAIAASVRAAIERYLEYLPFDGVFLRNGLIDYVQAVPGVRDIDISDLAAKYEGGVYIQVGRSWQSVSGAIRLSEAPSDYAVTLIAA